MNRSRAAKSPAPETSYPLSVPPIGAQGSPRAELSWDPESDAYVFTVDPVAYRVVLAPQDERTGRLQIDGQVNGGEWQPLLPSAGMLLREPEGAVLPPGQNRAELQELRHNARGRILSLAYTEELDGRVLKRSVQVRLTGRSLRIDVEAPACGEPLAPAQGYCGFSLGPLGPHDSRRVTVPGLPDPLIVLSPEGFLCAYPDRYQGHATAYPPGAAFYRPDSEGRCRAVRESFYVTLSPDPLETLPSLQRRPALYMDRLYQRVVLDLFSESSYEQDAELLRLLRLYGLQDVLLIYRNWQQFGYRRRAPVHYPADPSRGSNESFRRLVTEAEEAGWLVALREEYAGMTPDSPYWNEKALATWWDGLPRRTRHGGQFAIAADRMLDYARLEATKIQRNYRPDAVFVDGHTAWNPETGLRQVDDAAGSRAQTESQAIRQVDHLLMFLRDVHGGPVIGSSGEGPVRFDTFAEGMAEAVVRGPDGGARAPLIVDYELREVRPRLLGIGAGTYRQFCSLAAGEPVDAGRVDMDAYRATEIALGHAGYAGNYGIRPNNRGIPFPGGSATAVVREYYLLRALQELYLGTPLASVHYRAGDRMLTLAEALREESDLSRAQLRIEYGNGLVVWVNGSGEESWSVEHEEGACDLPPTGFLAVLPRQKFLGYSAAVGGNRVDFCRSAAYTFLDVRSQQSRTVEGITTDGSAALLKSAVSGRQDVVLVAAKQLRLDDDEYLLSERGDLRLTHVSPVELELTVLDTASGKPAHVTLPVFTAAWSDAKKLDVLEWEEGAWRPSRIQVQPTRTGPQISRAFPGVTYRVRARRV